MNDFIKSIFEKQSSIELPGIIADIEVLQLYSFNKISSNLYEAKKLEKIFNCPIGDNFIVQQNIIFFFEQVFPTILQELKKSNIDIVTVIESEDILSELSYKVHRLLLTLKYSKDALIKYYENI